MSLSSSLFIVNIFLKIQIITQNYILQLDFYIEFLLKLFNDSKKILCFLKVLVKNIKFFKN